MTDQMYERRLAEEDLGFEDYWMNRIGLKDHPLQEFATAHPEVIHEVMRLMDNAWRGGVRWQQDKR